MGGTISNFTNLSINVIDWQDGNGDLFSAQAPSNGNFGIFQNSNGIFLRYDAVPEPTTWSILGLALLFVTGFTRRRLAK